MRRTILLGLVTFLLLAAVPLVLSALQGLSRGTGAAASSLACSVKTSCGAGEVAVFRVSGLANAHAQTTAFSSYPYIVCCGGPVGLSNVCSGPYDTVLTLSATDNAHVASTGYGTQVCLAADAGVDCEYGPSCSAGYACLATISDTTNAHVADCDGSGDYGTKVCCAATTACIDRLGDTSCDDPVNDPDDDGCTAAEETALGSVFDGTASGWYDVYDVPVPAKADVDGANGVRNKLVDIPDVLAVLFYAFAEPTGTCGDNPNAEGVDYDCVKGVDLDGDTDDDVGTSHGIKEGVKYDRSPGLDPDPVTGIDPAGPPNDVIDMQDVLATIAQAFVVDCTAP